MDIPAHRPQRKPLLTPAMKAWRLAFAKAYIGKPLSFWRRAVFEDETDVAFTPQFNPRSLVYGDEPWVAVVPTSSHPQNFKVAGMITALGPGGLVEYQGGLDAAQYCDLLRIHLIPAINHVMAGKWWVLFQDGAPSHRARMTQTFLEHNVPCYVPANEWPPNSPNLNPIEHVWAMLKKKTWELDHSSFHAFKRAFFQLWDQLESSLLEKMILSLPDRLQAVIDCEGGWIPY